MVFIVYNEMTPAPRTQEEAKKGKKRSPYFIRFSLFFVLFNSVVHEPVSRINILNEEPGTKTQPRWKWR